MLKAFPLDFDRAAGYAYPRDRHLHQLAVEFAEKELAALPNFADYSKVWVACEVDANGQPQSVAGLLGFNMRPDFGLDRFTSPEAIELLHDRANSYLADQGMRGQECLVLLRSNENPKLKCPEGLRTMIKLGAQPGDRWSIFVK